MIASDIHFNPFADPTLAADLAKAPVHKWEAILSRTSPTAYSPYGQDTNWWLLRSALDAMRKAEPNPTLVMVTGDLLAHGFPEKYAKPSPTPTATTTVLLYPRRCLLSPLSCTNATASRKSSSPRATTTMTVATTTLRLEDPF